MGAQEEAVAGDWIMVRDNLHDDPRVLALTRRLREPDPDLVVGKLLRLWIYADQHTTDGVIRLTTATDLDVVLGYPGFAKALAAVGWLAIDAAANSLTIPNFGEFNSRSAKARALGRKRVQEHRARNGTPSQPAAPCNGQALQRPPHSGAGEITSALPEKRREEKRISGEESPPPSCPEPAGPAAGPDDPSPVVLTFPTVGPEDGSHEWHLTEAKVAEWRAAYPGIDAPAECRKALQWLLDNPTKRKTARGMPRYLGSWLARAQDRCGSPPLSAGPRPAGPGPITADRIRELRERHGQS